MREEFQSDLTEISRLLVTMAAAVPAALLGRFYERYADHAANVGEHLVYLITGEQVDDLS